MNNYQYKYITEGEGFEYLCSLSEHDISSCPSRITIRIFPGQDFVIYNYDRTYEFNLLTVIRVLNITADNWGVAVSYIDRCTSKVHKITHIPTSLAGYDVYAHVPQSVSIERTFRRDMSGQGRRPYASVSAAIVLFHKSLDKIATGQDYAMPVSLARKVGLGDGCFEQQCKDKGVIFEY